MAAAAAAPLSDTARFFTLLTYAYLHDRQVYPSDYFERQRAFDTVVYVSKHKSLAEYVESTWGSAEMWRRRGALLAARASLSEGKTGFAERLEFEFEPNAVGGESEESAPEQSKLSLSNMRSALVRATMGSGLPPVPAGTRFALNFKIDTSKRGPDQDETDTRKWIEADLSAVPSSSSSATPPSPEAQVIPVGTLREASRGQWTVSVRIVTSSPT